MWTATVILTSPRWWIWYLCVAGRTRKRDTIVRRQTCGQDSRTYTLFSSPPPSLCSCLLSSLAPPPLPSTRSLLSPSFLAVCFMVFDEDRDGVLSRSEFTRAVTLLLKLRRENAPPADKRVQSGAETGDRSFEAGAGENEGSEVSSVNVCWMEISQLCNHITMQRSNTPVQRLFAALVEHLVVHCTWRAWVCGHEDSAGCRAGTLSTYVHTMHAHAICIHANIDNVMHVLIHVHGKRKLTSLV